MAFIAAYSLPFQTITVEGQVEGGKVHPSCHSRSLKMNSNEGTANEVTGKDEKVSRTFQPPSQPLTAFLSKS